MLKTLDFIGLATELPLTAILVAIKLIVMDTTLLIIKIFKMTI